MENQALVAIGVMTSVALLALLTLLPIKPPHNQFEGIDFQDLIPEPDPADLQAHMAYCIAPWGQIVGVYFSADQWQMLHQAAKMGGQSIDELITEIAAQRYARPDSDIDPPF